MHRSRRSKRWAIFYPVLSDGFRYPLPLGSAFGSENSSGRKQQLTQNKKTRNLTVSGLLARREGFEPPAFWSVGCLKGKSELFRLRFVLFTTVCSADFPLFPSSPNRFFRILGQKWVKISSQAFFKAGMSFTRVFHTEGMPIPHLLQGGLVSHPYEGTCCRITLYPIGCAHDIFLRSD